MERTRGGRPCSDPKKIIIRAWVHKFIYESTNIDKYTVYVVRKFDKNSLGFDEHEKERKRRVKWEIIVY